MKWDWKLAFGYAFDAAAQMASVTAEFLERVYLMLDADHTYREEQRDWMNAVGEAINALPESTEAD